MARNRTRTAATSTGSSGNDSSGTNASSVSAILRMTGRNVFDIRNAPILLAAAVVAASPRT